MTLFPHLLLLSSQEYDSYGYTFIVNDLCLIALKLGK